MKKRILASRVLCFIIASVISVPLHTLEEHFSFKKAAATICVAGVSSALAVVSARHASESDHAPAASAACLFSTIALVRAGSSLKKQITLFNQQNADFLGML